MTALLTVVAMLTVVAILQKDRAANVFCSHAGLS
jgi:hypothetical protein